MIRQPNPNPPALSEFEQTHTSIIGVNITYLNTFEDKRGSLIELFRTNELNVVPVMAYLSKTKPGVQRGPHEHMAQTDVFVFLDVFDVFLWDNRPESKTYKQKQFFVAPVGCRVVVPPGVVHAYALNSRAHFNPGLVFNAPDTAYGGWDRTEPVDEIRHEEDPTSPFNVRL